MKRKLAGFILIFALMLSALPFAAAPAYAEEIPAIRLDIVPLTAGGSYTPDGIVSVPDDAPYKIALCIWDGPDGSNEIKLAANEPHVLRVIVSTADAHYSFGNNVDITVNGADSHSVESAGKAIMLLITVSAKEIEAVSLTVTPPAAGTKSLECPPQAVLNSTGCKIKSAYWLVYLNGYTTWDLDVTFAEGETYYMLVYLQADAGSAFRKSGETYGGIDEGADKFKGCTVTGGTLEHAGSRTLNTDSAKGDFLTVKIGVTAVKAAAPEKNYFAVWISDTAQKPNTGGSVKIEYTAANGEALPDSGKIYSGPTNQIVPGDVKVTLTAVPAEGYYFVGWFRANIDKANADDPQFLEDGHVSAEQTYAFPEKPFNICAVFEKAPAHPADQVEVWATDGGKIAVKYAPDEEAGPIRTHDGSEFAAKGEIVAFYKGDEVTVIAKADEGYVFKGWYRANFAWEHGEGERYAGSAFSTAAAYSYKPGVTVLPGDKEALRVICAVFEKAPAFMLGDLNGDGKITAADARIALRMAVKLEPCEPGTPAFRAADVNLDGKVSSADARLILRRSVHFTDPEWGGKGI